jgi:hypothetical protein
LRGFGGKRLRVRLLRGFRGKRFRLLRGFRGKRLRVRLLRVLVIFFVFFRFL